MSLSILGVDVGSHILSSLALAGEIQCLIDLNATIPYFRELLSQHNILALVSSSMSFKGCSIKRPRLSLNSSTRPSASKSLQS